LGCRKLEESICTLRAGKNTTLKGKGFKGGKGHLKKEKEKKRKRRSPWSQGILETVKVEEK